MGWRWRPQLVCLSRVCWGASLDPVRAYDTPFGPKFCEADGWIVCAAALKTNIGPFATYRETLKMSLYGGESVSAGAVHLEGIAVDDAGPAGEAILGRRDKIAAS